MAIIASGNSLTASATSAPLDWWLKDPVAASLNIVVLPEQDELEVEYPETSQDFTPLGRSRKVVLSDLALGAEFGLTLYFATLDAYEDFLALRDVRRTLLLQSPAGEHWYVRMGTVRLIRGRGDQRRVRVSFTEVEKP